jgi:hypothetical protein
MITRSWIRTLFARTPHRAPQGSRQAPPRFRPTLDVREERLTPSTLGAMAAPADGSVRTLRPDSSGVGPRVKGSSRGAASSPLRRGLFPRGVPARGAMVGGPFGALPHGDQRERAPPAVPVHDVQVAIAVTDKETLVHRLDDVFGIHLAPQPRVDVPEGKGDEFVGEAPEEFPGRGAVPASQPGQEFSEGIRHGSRPPCSRITGPGQGPRIFCRFPGAFEIDSMGT